MEMLHGAAIELIKLSNYSRNKKNNKIEIVMKK